MTLAAVADQLRHRAGLDAASIGPAALAAAVAGRQKAVGLTDPDAYAGRLALDATEFQALLEAVVVSETWFFRGRLFEFVAARVGAASRPCRILSLACSTGEEPYSQAIALLEAGVDPARWTIEGVDVSRRSLARAGQARYGAFSFRELPPTLRDRYFLARESGWELRGDVRAAVRFREGNLLDEGLLADESPYDVVFCRNVLIYFHAAARTKVIRTLDRLLAADGLLCTGHAEPLSLLDARFAPTGPEGMFLYRRRGPSEPTFAPRTADSPALTVRSPVPAPAVKFAPAASASALRSPAAVVLKADRLDGARRHADSGKLDEALAECEAELARTGPSADLFLLLGEVHQARHDPAAAARHWQRALYLEPDHPEALLHLVLLCERQGDHAKAALLRKRLRRTQPAGDA
jgi:chemotaxis protein methyltransferase WspC